tara:strand:+ start:767 stop:1366 length:600 start_codon:yes stop_codon:yes gene_type:complete
MLKTPQHFKRQVVRDVNKLILGGSLTRLSPLSINVNESQNDDFTVTDFSFKLYPEEEVISISNSKGKGFIDGLFGGLHKHFVVDYPSLSKISLVDLKVNPIMSKSKSLMGTDAQASVLFVIGVDDHGLAEFQHQSRSVIRSSFIASLNAFQFYINCERCFDKIHLGLADAHRRNRHDIVEKCRFNLSKLTEVNTYERKE